MKISASIYSDKNRNLRETIEDLKKHNVDLLHIDCNDDLTIFEDIKQIRIWTNIPIDLHIITKKPSKYYKLLEENPVEYITFQFEDLEEKLEIPSSITGKKGLAIITPTPVDVFGEFTDFDFILIMATVPGQSGGVFDKINFDKIRNFKKKYPTKSIHVDGGVNSEVSFILRNMGVSSSVSGSYLFNASSVGNALINLTSRAIESHYLIQDFMVPLAESPVIQLENLDFLNVLKSIEKGSMGFTIVVSDNNRFEGIISNADIRRLLIKDFEKLPNVNTKSLLNRSAVCINENQNVVDMFQIVKKSIFPIMYLPVINDNHEAVGMLSFINLIKGEL